VHHSKYSELVRVFLQSPAWKLVHFDNVAAVFVDRSSIDKTELEKLQPDIGTERFGDLANPALLFSLFRIYALIDLEKAHEIVDIYQRNVSGLYANKKQHLRLMQRMLSAG